MYVTEMKMPSAFVSLSVDEMEYDGEGLFSSFFKKVATACFVVAAACFVVGLCINPIGFCCTFAFAGIGAGLLAAGKGKYFI